MLAAFALLLTSCRAELNLVVEIEEEGSGRFTIEAGIDDELANLIGDIPDVDALTLALEAFDFGSLVDGEAGEYTEGDMQFRTVSAAFSDFDDLRADLIHVVNSPFRELMLVRSDEDMSLDAEVALPDLTALIEATELPIDPSFLENDALSAALRIRLPGTIDTHDADRIDGEFLEWDLPLTGGVTTVTARSTFDQPGFAWWSVALAVLIIGGLGVLFVARGKREAVEEAALDAAEAEDHTPLGMP